MKARLTVIVVLLVIAAACGSTSDNSSASGSDTGTGDAATGDAATGDAVGGDTATGEGATGDATLDGDTADGEDATGETTGDGGVPAIDETLALDRGTGSPEVDAYVPSVPPSEPIGRPGYTRYVYTRSGDEIIPALVEGPRLEQTRCQNVDLPCSFEDLAALQDSGEPIPDSLGLSSQELGALVEELTALRATLADYATPDAACAAGYRPDRKQTPNMGSHFSNNDLIDATFDPAAPEILLYARVDGTEPDGALGVCRGGRWDGEEIEIVGAAYFIPWFFVGTEHFSGFSGDLDNWHIHYNLCRLDGQDVTVDPSDCGSSGRSAPPDQPRGDASEGWMIHAWAGPDFDNQLGVFSMWNPTLWPVADPEAVFERGSLSTTIDENNIISDFELPEIVLTEPGTLSFFNADSEAHTVTAGSPTDPSELFDSGVIAGRGVDEIVITEPGTYSYFCEIHPTMQGTISVG